MKLSRNRLHIIQAKMPKCNGVQLIWEISVHSKDEDAPKLTELETFWSWLGSAHDVIEKWFFKLIEGDLEKQFRGE
jgi:uncharacterized protein (TIGR04255 family)